MCHKFIILSYTYLNLLNIIINFNFKESKKRLYIYYLILIRNNLYCINVRINGKENVYVCMLVYTYIIKFINL